MVSASDPRCVRRFVSSTKMLVVQRKVNPFNASVGTEHAGPTLSTAFCGKSDEHVIVVRFSLHVNPRELMQES